MRRSATARPALSALLSPDELKQLARARFAEAMLTESVPERLRVMAFAGTLLDLADTKTLLLRYERRLFE